MFGSHHKFVCVFLLIYLLINSMVAHVPAVFNVFFRTQMHISVFRVHTLSVSSFFLV